MFLWLESGDLTLTLESGLGSGADGTTTPFKNGSPIKLVVDKEQKDFVNYIIEESPELTY